MKSPRTFIGSAARMRLTRARRAAGRRVFRVEADEIALEQMLADLGHLPPSLADDPASVETALSAMLARLIALHSKG